MMTTADEATPAAITNSSPRLRTADKASRLKEMAAGLPPPTSLPTSPSEAEVAQNTWRRWEFWDRDPAREEGGHTTELIAETGSSPNTPKEPNATMETSTESSPKTAWVPTNATTPSSPSIPAKPTTPTSPTSATAAEPPHTQYPRPARLFGPNQTPALRHTSPSPPRPARAPKSHTSLGTVGDETPGPPPRSPRPASPSSSASSPSMYSHSSGARVEACPKRDAGGESGFADSDLDLMLDPAFRVLAVEPAPAPEYTKTEQEIPVKTRSSSPSDSASSPKTEETKLVPRDKEAGSTAVRAEAAWHKVVPDEAAARTSVSSIHSPGSVSKAANDDETPRVPFDEKAANVVDEGKKGGFISVVRQLVARVFGCAGL